VIRKSVPDGRCGNLEATSAKLRHCCLHCQAPRSIDRRLTWPERVTTDKDVPQVCRTDNASSVKYHFCSMLSVNYTLFAV